MGGARDFARQCKIAYSMARGIEFLHSRWPMLKGLYVVALEDIFAKIDFFSSTWSPTEDIETFRERCEVILRPLDRRYINVAVFLQLFSTRRPMNFLVTEFRPRSATARCD
jgi:hypothetical protein